MDYSTQIIFSNDIKWLSVGIKKADTKLVGVGGIYYVNAMEGKQQKHSEFWQEDR